MENILSANPSYGMLLQNFVLTQRALKFWRVVVAPEKIQRQYFFQYSGSQLYPRKIVVQKIQEKSDLLTSKYFQKLPGDVYWLRPTLSLPQEDLSLC
jgi:hypothetical protein